MNINRDIKLPEHCTLLSEFNDCVLAERAFKIGDLNNIEYITWYCNKEGEVSLGHYFAGDMQAAKEDFAKRSGLVAESKLFNEGELSVLYRGLNEYEKNCAVDYDDKDLCMHIENARAKLERVPDIDIEKYSRVSVLIVEPDREPYEKSMICEKDSYSEVIGGYIDETFPFDDTAIVLAGIDYENPELPFNRAISGQDYHGTIIITNTNSSGNIISLTEHQKKEYLEMLKLAPEKDKYLDSIDKALKESTSIPINTTGRER